MFFMRLERSITTQTIFETINNFEKKIILFCDQNGIRIQVTQSDGKAILFLHLRPEAFHTYRCDDNFIWEINIDILIQMLYLLENENSTLLVLSRFDLNLMMFYIISNNIQVYFLK